MDRDEMIRRLSEAFPREAIKQRQGGRGKMLSYLDGATVIRRLNYATENTWDFRVLNEERLGNLLSAYVELTIPGLGSRQHKGVQRIEANAGEDIEKGAITDALKKAATLFGVGLETYADEHEAAATGTTSRQVPQDAADRDSLIPHEWRGRLDFDSDNPNANRPKGQEVPAPPRQTPQDAPKRRPPAEPLTPHQQGAVDSAWDMAASDTYPAVLAMLRTVFPGATPGQLTALDDERRTIAAKHFPDATMNGGSHDYRSADPRPLAARPLQGPVR